MVITPHFEVMVSFPAWRDALMPLLANPELIATGRLVRAPDRQPTGLIVEELSVGARSRTGKDFAPLADWIAVAVSEEGSDHPTAWLSRLQPLFPQLLALVLVGGGSGRETWSGWTIERGDIRPLAGLRIIGPGMVHATTHMEHTNPPTIEEDTRWTRLRGVVGETVFARLRETQVALVGCSRTGSLVAAQFAALGIRRLTLIDGDAIEPHNLDGMILCAEADIGTSKAIALGRRLTEFHGGLTVRALAQPLNSRTAEPALAGADLIVTCVDRDGPRLRAAREACARLTPHLDIGTGVTRSPAGELLLAADIRLLLPRAGCIRCVGGLVDLEQADYELHAPAGALPRRPPEPWNARGRLGSLLTLNSLAVSLGVQSWLDLLSGALTASVWHRLSRREDAGLETHSALATAAPDCTLCGRN